MNKVSPKPTTKLYRQEGKTGMYQSTLWALAVSKAQKANVPVSWGEYFVFFKKNSLDVYWDENGLENVATAVIKKAKDGFPPEWQKEWKDVDRDLTDTALALVRTDMSALSVEELKAIYEKLFDLDQHFWNVSIFIDAFDPGFDREEMNRVAKESNLTDEEVQALVTPVQPAYITEWHRALEEVAVGKMTRDELHETFFWYATDYWQFGELTDKFIDEELEKRTSDHFISPKEEQEKILTKHGLSSNPLELFNILTTWRDERKRLNYIGAYGLMKVLHEILRRHNINSLLANALLPDQVSDLFDGHITQAQLQKQFDEGVLLHVNEEGKQTFYFEEEAQESYKSLDTALEGGEKELKGVTASRGKATGRVCIVPHVTNQQAALMQEGDILVTSMTRPEFVPLMRKSGAIVTNEGGITSHAAIVSRELKKPCVIGTKIATKVLRNGDLVEVDADSGLVRILERL